MHVCLLLTSAFEDTTLQEQETVLGYSLQKQTPTAPALHENSAPPTPPETVPEDPMEGPSREIYNRVHVKRPKISPAH